MNAKAPIALAVAACLLSLGTAGQARDPASCNYAVREYNDAMELLAGNLRRHLRCLSLSEGKDDCSSEFRRVRASQGAFEMTVSDYQRECR